MLVSTIRYPSKKITEFSKAFANATSSKYLARGKKPIETIVSLARKIGEHTIAIIFNDKISFISISPFEWEWKKEALQIKKYEIRGSRENGLAYETEGRIKGTDAPLLEKLFGFDSFYGGEITISAENGKMKFLIENETLLEMEYSILAMKKIPVETSQI